MNTVLRIILVVVITSLSCATVFCQSSGGGSSISWPDPYQFIVNTIPHRASPTGPHTVPFGNGPLLTSNIESPQDQNDGTLVIGEYNEEVLAGSRSLTKEELEDWIRDANQGLEQRLIYRISKETSFSSVGDFVAWTFDAKRSMLELRPKELVYANEQLLRRRENRDKHLSICGAKLAGKNDLKESDIGNALRQLRLDELKSEKQLYESLEELLHPKRKEALCRELIKHGLQSANVPMVVDYLKMSPKQVALFRAAVESIMKSLEKQPPEIGKDATKKILAAENSLSLDQFVVYAECVGKLERGKTLKEHLDQLDKQKQKELCDAYELFRKARQQ